MKRPSVTGVLSVGSDQFQWQSISVWFFWVNSPDFNFNNWAALKHATCPSLEPCRQWRLFQQLHKSRKSYGVVFFSFFPPCMLDVTSNTSLPCQMVCPRRPGSRLLCLQLQLLQSARLHLARPSASRCHLSELYFYSHLFGLRCNSLTLSAFVLVWLHVFGYC